MTTTNDDDATRIQPAAVRDFNQQLAEAYMNPQDYDRYSYLYVDPLPPETTTPLPNGPLPPDGGSGTPGDPPAPALSPAGAVPRRAQPKPKTWPWLLAVVAALLVGLWAGGASETGQPTSAPAPTATVTVSAEPEIRAVTPKACIQALRASDQVFGIVGKVLGAVSAAMDGVATLDPDKINAQTVKMRRYRRQLEPIAATYRAKRDECNASDR